MLTVEWSNEAQLDFVEIQLYISARNPEASQKLADTIENAVEQLLPRMPYAFKKGRVSGTREYVVHPNYIVIYRVGNSTVKVLRILHAKREYP